MISKLCTFIMRLKYVLWLQADFYGEGGDQMALLIVNVLIWSRLEYFN